MKKIYESLNSEQKNSLCFAFLMIVFWLLVILSGNWTFAELKRSVTEPSGVLTWTLLSSWIYGSYLSYEMLKIAFFLESTRGIK